MSQTNKNAEKAQIGVYISLSELQLELKEMEAHFKYMELIEKPLKGAFQHLYMLRAVIELEEKRISKLN